MLDSRVIQFEIWNECNNGCKFCFNRYVYDLSDEQKLRSLNIVLQKISDLEIYKTYNKIAFIGGEFFQGQLRNNEVREAFFKTIDKINELLEAGYIEEFWITATLTIGKQEDLFELFKRIKKHSAIWICTSYDAVGRFTPEKLLAWQENMQAIKAYDPSIRINVTTIITGQFADDYLSGKFKLDEFRSKYQCAWFSKTPLLPAGCGMTKAEYNKTIPNFFPSRKPFLSFLTMFRQQESAFDYDKLYGSEFRSNALIKTYSDDQMLVLLRDKSSKNDRIGIVSNEDFQQHAYKGISFVQKTCKCCNHSQEYQLYVDSDRCFICDKEMIKQMF